MSEKCLAVWGPHGDQNLTLQQYSGLNITVPTSKDSGTFSTTAVFVREGAQVGYKSDVSPYGLLGISPLKTMKD